MIRGIWSEWYNEAAIINYARELNTSLDVPRYAVSRTSRIAAMFTYGCGRH